MKAKHLLLSLVIAQAIAFAIPVYINDPFPGLRYAVAGYDVIGNPQDFDIERIFGNINPEITTLRIDLNYPNADLSPFVDFAGQLNPADLLFSIDGTLAYGIPLATHAGSPNHGPSGLPVLAGHVYQINDPTAGVLTARQVLNNPTGVIYRPSEPVWLRNDGAGSVLDQVAGSVAVHSLGNGLTKAKYEVTLSFATPSRFWADVTTYGAEISFGNATCANDVIHGGVPPSAPEPGGMTLIGAGLVGLGVMGQRLRRRG